MKTQVQPKLPLDGTSYFSKYIKCFQYAGTKFWFYILLHLLICMVYTTAQGLDIIMLVIKYLSLPKKTILPYSILSYFSWLFQVFLFQIN